ncbi:hypothetical protein EV294_1162 [Paenibacillus sp. BK033]|uniref:rRNA methylase n=1 Tax=Paenibacillus sp. BK033 TaxID=2512133 RepID=UPI001051D849|nr:rRNA methylase [Paenibacillus sp. BK033]TCM87922.1 hypothetical protein EV294_1162 [Paenibacillus sp. BK033]
MKISGYRVIKGKEQFNHTFGGVNWKTPVCVNCLAPMHLIFCFDLTDPRLNGHYKVKLESLPLVTCLNCSGYWAPQVFQLDPIANAITIVKQTDVEHWIMEDEDKLPVPLPLSNVKLIPLTKKDILLDDLDNDESFTLFGSEYICRLLGPPLFATDKIQKRCSSCSKEMQYIATVCSEDYDSEGLIHEGFSFHIGESFIFFYLCTDCLRLETEMQSTS